MCGLDLRDDLSQELWAWEDEEEEEEGCYSSFIAEISNEIRANICLKRNEEKKTNLPLSGSGEGIDHLKGFWSSDHDEPRDKNDQHDETFPTNPKSWQLEFSENTLNFP